MRRKINCKQTWEQMLLLQFCSWTVPKYLYVTWRVKIYIVRDMATSRRVEVIYGQCHIPVRSVEIYTDLLTAGSESEWRRSGGKGERNLVTGYCYWGGRTRRPSHCDHFWSIVRVHLGSIHSWFIHRSSPAIRPTGRDISSEAGESWREMAAEFCLRSLCFHTRMVL
jgi:hypothetical protein